VASTSEALGKDGSEMATAVIVSALVGAVCGLVPLVYGLVRGEIGLAAGGFAACIVSGVVLGVLLAAPVAALFTWLVWRASRERHAAAGAQTPPRGFGAAPERTGTRLDERRTGERLRPERDRVA
jgi:membrane protein implicated in regulation of membrane protease activity